jgi:hypothetical protein
MPQPSTKAETISRRVRHIQLMIIICKEVSMLNYNGILVQQKDFMLIIVT